MSKLIVPLASLDRDYLSQLQYSMAFASEDILSYAINAADATIEAELAPQAAHDEVRRKIEALVKRYAQEETGLASVIHYQLDRDLPVIDAWSQLLERKWITPVGTGHVILRGPAAQLLRLIDTKIQSVFVPAFAAELEVYPSTIKCETLDRCNHFSSFPEHVDFVSHLREDVDVLNGFSARCRDERWSASLHEGAMDLNEFAISPSCCYHCYEGMEGWALDAPGRCTTMTVGCHRYEGANHRTMTRLRAFTMRELVWVGQPRYVMEARARAEDLIVQWARDWELVCTLETANDMFFTADYAVKASFQRQQQAKRELRMRIPSEQTSISVFSSNFHASTFGKAFNITIGGRPATSGCIGWGYERWVYGIFSQFGLDTGQWPAKLRQEFDALSARA